jgi:hypothetical protein
LDITLIIPAQNNYDFTICEGEQITFDNVVYEFDTSGIYTQYILGPSGCNEIELIFNITVSANVYTQLDTTICEGQSYEGFEIAGVYEIETVDSITGCSIFLTLTLDVLPMSDPECISSTDEMSVDDVNLFPIPASELIFLESESIIKNVTIYSSTGKILRKLINQQTSELTIDVTDLPIGFHLIMVETNLGRVMKKVIISR